jgi:hypothetical protein
MTNEKTTVIRLTRVLAIIGLLLVGSAVGADDSGDPMSAAFETLEPQVDIVYLLANSSLIVGADVEGPAEDITFTGTVAVPKYPVDGFERRELPSGRYQIDFELTDSKLKGESYLMNGPVLLGEHPDLRSLGTITQENKGQDYPANFIVQRKVLIETPKGVMYNEEPVPVRGRINSIPPVRRVPDGEETNVFRGKELPIALLGEEGDIAGWFYSTVHVAYAVEPVAIYRMAISGSVDLEVGDQKETVRVEGPMEIVEEKENKGKPEVVMMALRGESDLLGGQIMITESFHPEKQFSYGSLGAESGFDLHLEVKTPSGKLMVEEPIHVSGSSSPPQQVGIEDLGPDGEVPVLTLAFREEGSGMGPLSDEAGRTVGALTGLRFDGERVSGRRPCCPLPGEKEEKTASVGTHQGARE